MATQTDLGFGKLVERGKDLFLSHTGVDKPWVEALAEKIELVRYGDRYLGVVLDKWDFEKGKNIVLDIDRTIDDCRFIGLVVSKAMLQAEWPTMERSIAVWSDPSGRRGRVLVLLIENVELPASLRIRNWIDFRDPGKFEESFQELIGVLTQTPRRRGRGGLTPNLPSATLPYTPAPVVITASSGAERIQERLVSNLLPVIEIPTVIQVAETAVRDKADLPKATGREPPPCILREGQLFTFSDLHNVDNILQECIDIKSLHDETFAPWFGEEDRRRWAVELLNVCLRQHCWNRWLRFDGKAHRYFFAPRRGKPVKIWWNLGGKRQREVTARHFARRPTEDGGVETYQYGWRHQGIRANFVHLPMGLFLRIMPTYMLTKDDGKTPRGGKRVGPILSQWLNQERNGQILRSIRFWSLVLTRGNKAELVIPTGHERIVIGLIPANGELEFGISGDSVDYDRLLQAEFEDDLAVPDLAEEAPAQMLLFGDE
jgi:hypothetical protein